MFDDDEEVAEGFFGLFVAMQCNGLSWSRRLLGNLAPLAVLAILEPAGDV